MPEGHGRATRCGRNHSRTAGIKRVEVLEFLRDAVFADPTKAFNPDKSIKPPDQWPEDLRKLVTSYNAGTVMAAERITFGNRIDPAFKLFDEIRPLGDWPKTEVSGAVNVQSVLAILNRGPSLPAQ